MCYLLLLNAKEELFSQKQMTFWWDYDDFVIHKTKTSLTLIFILLCQRKQQFTVC